ncbi:surface-adhesin E family protein [Nostoc sp. UIC 10607]|uniref:surface-adhesin E family protein n=1 Tax=Nostoc sp. UIC 10607 TaxID=3045935 RepID=UPI0039A09319
MLKKLAASAIASTIALAPMVAKAEWVAVSESDDLIAYVGDRVTVTVSDSQPAFYWQRVVYKKAQDGVKAVVSYNAVNCNPLAARAKEMIFYDSRGSIIKRQDLSETSDWESPIPGSHLEASLETICK